MLNHKTQFRIVLTPFSILILLSIFMASLTLTYFTARSSTTTSNMTFEGLAINSASLSTNKSCTHAGVMSSLTLLEPGCTIEIGSSNAIVVTGNIDALL